jgi:hypothetical protein
VSGTKQSKFFKDLAREMQIPTRQAAQWFRLEDAPIYLHEVKRPAVNNVRDRRTGVALFLTKKARSQGLSL